MARAGTTAVGESDILARVGLTAVDLPHPVDRLTVEQAASHAGLSVTTVDSAIGSADDFRAQVLEHAIRSLRTKPGATVWAALQEVVATDQSELDLSPLFKARVRELTDQPAFVIFLSGFERLGDPGTNAAVNDVLYLIFLDFWPFLQTAHSAFGVPCPLTPSPELEFIGLQAILGAGLVRLLCDNLNPADEQAVWRLLSTLFEDLVSGENLPLSEAALFPNEVRPARIQSTGVAAQAIEAGADLLCSGQIIPATRLTVAEAAERCELSVSAFYRQFSSLAEFESRVFRTLDRSFPTGFAPGFLERLSTDAIGPREGDPAGALGDFSATLSERQLHHALAGRRGIQLLPWLGSPVIGPLLKASSAARYDERGAALDRLLPAMERSIGFELSGTALASILGCTSVAVEYLLRNSPDPQATSAWLSPIQTYFLGEAMVTTGE